MSRTSTDDDNDDGDNHSSNNKNSNDEMIEVAGLYVRPVRRPRQGRSSMMNSQVLQACNSHLPGIPRPQ